MLFLLAWLLLALLFQRHLVFPRYAASAPARPGAGIPNLEQSLMETAEGPMDVWFAPAVGSSAARPGPAVILMHGNGDLIDYQHDIVVGYQARGVSVLLCEYRGYGRSAGSPSQDKITADHVSEAIQFRSLDRQLWG